MFMIFVLMLSGQNLNFKTNLHFLLIFVTIVVGSNKGRRNNKVERRSRFISSSLSPIWLLRSSGLHRKVGLYSASKRCRRNGNIVTSPTDSKSL